MPVTAGESLNLGQLKTHGLSLSGIRTAISLPELSIAFDVAQGYPFLLTIKNFFISHGHLDHAAGIPYIISQKTMTRQPKAKFYMPPSLVEPMTEIMNLWQKIEDHRYEYDFIPFRPDETVALNAQYFIKAFPTIHRIESNGYTLFRIQKKLKDELKNLSEKEILELKKSGAEVNQIQEIPVLSFTGDTQIEFLDSRDWIRHSQYLFLEATYFDERKSIEHAKTWGHTHLDELIPRLDDIKSEKIILIHLSSRYTTQEAERILQQRIPASHRDRVILYPGR